MEAVLEDKGLKEFIDKEIQKPTSTNAQELAEWKKCVAKVMSPKFGNILGSFGLIILVQSFIFHNLCIIFQYVYVICTNKGRHSSLVANTCSFQVF